MIKYIVQTENKVSTISKHIYGHFTEHLGRCIYNGIFVGEDSPIENTNGIRNDIIKRLKQIKTPVIRWPGGCFADEYHWKDGIGPLKDRKRMINTHWGGVLEDNSFGTHEFLKLCELLECEPYINGNVGSGTVQEMSEWVEYMTFDGESPMTLERKQNGQDAPWSLKYFGVGNENWGCGGNMTAQYYSDVYKQFQTYLRNFGDNKLYKIACGPNSFDYQWTKVLMEKAANHMDALSLHYYTLPTDNWEHKGSATEFDRHMYYQTIQRTLKMDELITKHKKIMDEYDPDKKVDLIVDEWGAWYDVEPGTNPGFLYQQNTMRDAMIAACNLNIFNKHADRVHMANIAQMVNVLQAIILTEGEKLILTPTYHVFDMFSDHMENTLLNSQLFMGNIEDDGLSLVEMTESASMTDDDKVVITLSNIDADQAKEVSVELLDYEVHSVSGQIIAGHFNSYNSFDEPNAVEKKGFDSFKVEKDSLMVALPPCSIVKLVMS